MRKYSKAQLSAIFASRGLHFNGVFTWTIYFNPKYRVWLFTK